MRNAPSEPRGHSLVIITDLPKIGMVQLRQAYETIRRLDIRHLQLICRHNITHRGDSKKKPPFPRLLTISSDSNTDTAFESVSTRREYSWYSSLVSCSNVSIGALHCSIVLFCIGLCPTIISTISLFLSCLSIYLSIEQYNNDVLLIMNWFPIIKRQPGKNEVNTDLSIYFPINQK